MQALKIVTLLFCEYKNNVWGTGPWSPKYSQGLNIGLQSARFDLDQDRDKVIEIVRLFALRRDRLPGIVSRTLIVFLFRTTL